MTNKILIVDDEAENCHAISVFLEGMDVDLMYCAQGKDAIAHMKSINPSLVILDSELKDTDGYHVINDMWVDDELKQIPVLLMTTHFAERKQLLHQPLLEMIDTLPKPLNQALLRARVEQALTLRMHQKTIVKLLDDGGEAMRKRHEGVLAIDDEGRIIFSNATALALLRTNHQQLVGVYLQSLFEEPNHGVISEWHKHPIAMVCSQGNVLQVEHCVLFGADGQSFPVKLAAIPLEGTEAVKTILAFRKMKAAQTEGEEEAEAQLVDGLTGTLNLEQFEHRIELAIHCAKEGKDSKIAVFELDLAYFDHVNESLGHEIGDEILKDVVGRLQKVLRPVDRIARIRGDVFAILVEHLKASTYAAQIAVKVIEVLKAPFLVKGYELHLACSIGIATYPACGKDAKALMRNAKLAVEKADTKDE